MFNFGNDNELLISKLRSKLEGKNTLNVYCGSHGGVGADIADVVLPCTAWTERNATYLSTEGRYQTSKRAVSTPGLTRDTWKIIRALSEFCGARLDYDDHEQIKSKLH